MPPKPSLTAAGRSAAAQAAGGASKSAAAVTATAKVAAATAAEEVPYALLSVPEKFASVFAKLRGDGEWTQEELFDLMYW